VAADLCDLGFRIAGSTLGASLRAICGRMDADLDRVFSELDVTEFQRLDRTPPRRSPLSNNRRPWAARSIPTSTTGPVLPRFERHRT